MGVLLQDLTALLRLVEAQDERGPGRFRGGTGVDYEVEVAASAEYSFR
jgi:N-methylhydantoinase B/oxoprolinase/acetone carboxylase alpha subunit